MEPNTSLASTSTAPSPPTRTVSPSPPRACARTASTKAFFAVSSVPGAVVDTAYMRVVPSVEGTAGPWRVAAKSRGSFEAASDAGDVAGVAEPAVSAVPAGTVTSATCRSAVARSATVSPPSRW